MPPIGKARFWKLADALSASGLVEEIPFIRFLGRSGLSDGEAPRLAATGALRALAATFGCTPETRSQDWCIVRETPPPPVISKDDLVQFRDWPEIINGKVADKGHPSHFPPHVPYIVAAVERLNAACDTLTVTGCARPRFTRIYGPTLFHGGRYYATGRSDSFQQIRKEERPRITVNGEAVAEIDLKAAFLSIFLAYVKAPEPDGDPYAIEGFPRVAVKQFVLLSLQSGRLKKQWTPKDGPEVREVPIKALSKAVEARYPALEQLPTMLPPEALQGLPSEAHRAWATGQFLMNLESQIISEAISRTLDKGKIAWPMHDGLIVPLSGLEVARRALEGAYWERLDRKPKIEVEIPP